MTEQPDAVVIGAGPNGLVAANLLADAGWDVVVLEAQPEPGGAVRSGELTAPGFVHDRFSAFYPLAAASPVIQRLELERFGLRWCRAPAGAGPPHPRRPVRGALDRPRRDRRLARRLRPRRRRRAGDALYGRWERVGGHVIDALFTPFPPVRAGARLVARAAARPASLPLRPLRDAAGAAAGRGDVPRRRAAALLLAGNALHADLAPESALERLLRLAAVRRSASRSASRCPKAAPGELTAALVRRLESRGGRLRVRRRGSPASWSAAAGRSAVRTADGDEIGGRPGGARRRRRAGAVPRPGRRRAPAGARPRRHAAASSTTTGRSRSTGRSTGRSPGRRRAGPPGGHRPPRRLDGPPQRGRDATSRPAGSRRARSCLVGQMTTTDPTRSPPGTETAVGVHPRARSRPRRRRRRPHRRVGRA